MSEKLLTYCEQLLRTPTAPFREHWMIERLDSILSEIPGLRVQSDQWGNRLATVGPDNGQPPIVFCAHLDHPGFIFPPDQSGTELQAVFEGRVQDRFFLGAPVIVYTSDEQSGIPGVIASAGLRNGSDDNRQMLIHTRSPVENPILAMWDVEEFAFRDETVFGRACDDLCGAAAMLSALEELSHDQESLPTPVTMLFTRAEEAGFCGALCLAHSDEAEKYLPEGSRVLSIEISGETAAVRQGGGAVLRYGDRAGAFDRGLLTEIWQSVLNEPEETRPVVRRALMDMGTCEAAAFSSAGYVSAGLCAPVRHYHNMDFHRGQIGPESVSYFDLLELSRLIVLTARSSGSGGAFPPLANLTQLLERGRTKLSSPAALIQPAYAKESSS